MESIEKLRESLKDCTSEAGVEPNRFDTYWITANACDMLIDEIEREIAERYMELPVDMDGVPIKPNDKVTVPNAGSCYYDVFAIAGDYWTDVDGFVHKPEQTVHVKQRTVEDVLAEVENGELSIDDAAAEIRELLAGDGE